MTDQRMQMHVHACIIWCDAPSYSSSRRCACLSMCMSIGMHVYRHACLSVCMSIGVHVYRCACLSVFMVCISIGVHVTYRAARALGGAKLWRSVAGHQPNLARHCARQPHLENLVACTARMHIRILCTRAWQHAHGNTHVAAPTWQHARGNT